MPALVGWVVFVTLELILIITIVIVAVKSFEFRHSAKIFTRTIGYTLFFAFFALLLSGFIAWSIEREANRNGPWAEKSRVVAELRSLKDNIGEEGNISGSFLFASGSVSGQISSGLVLDYYAINEDGSYSPKSLNVADMNMVRIYETTSGDYRLEERYKVCTNENCSKDMKEFAGTTQWDFFVPPGSVKANFKMDAAS